MGFGLVMQVDSYGVVGGQSSGGRPGDDMHHSPLDWSQGLCSRGMSIENEGN